MRILNSWLRINKSYQSLRGVDAVTDPKTSKLVRPIVMPTFSNPAGGDHVETEIDLSTYLGRIQIQYSFAYELIPCPPLSGAVAPCE